MVTSSPRSRFSVTILLWLATWACICSMTHCSLTSATPAAIVLLPVYRQAIEDWKVKNPDEFQKEKESEEAWVATAKDRFAQLFRLAKKHHVHLQWCGTSPYYIRKENEEKRGPNTPDKWIIIQDTKRIAQICCM